MERNSESTEKVYLAYHPMCCFTWHFRYGVARYESVMRLQDKMEEYYKKMIGYKNIRDERGIYLLCEL